MSDAPQPSPGARHERRLPEDLILVFVLVMFIKVFLFEVYRIPSGSMTPTLLGGHIAWVELDGRDERALLYWENPGAMPLYFAPVEGRLRAQPAPSFTRRDPRENTRLVNDQILVNKMTCWFGRPERGDIVIFRPPAAIFTAASPIYIKRLVGLPGESLSFTPDGELIVDGERITAPPFFDGQRYRPVVDVHTQGYRSVRHVDYQRVSPTRRRLLRVHVPPGHIWVLGDNTAGSLDSRYWGALALDHLKGRAFMRVWPPSRIGLLD